MKYEKLRFVYIKIYKAFILHQQSRILFLDIHTTSESLASINEFML